MSYDFRGNAKNEQSSLFIVRVQLLAPDEHEPDYNDLHKAMDLKGFRRTIKLGAKEFKLPNAEYAIDDKRTKNEILNETIGVATTVWHHGCRVLVTQAAEEPAGELEPA